MNFKAVLVLPNTARSAQTHKSISFNYIVWSTLYVYLWLKSGLFPIKDWFIKMQTRTVVSILLFGFEFLWISLYLLIFDCETRFVIQKLDIIFWVRFCSTLQTMSDDFYLSRSFRSLVCLSVTGSFCQKQSDRLVKFSCIQES